MTGVKMLVILSVVSLTGLCCGCTSGPGRVNVFGDSLALQVQDEYLQIVGSRWHVTYQAFGGLQLSSFTDQILATRSGEILLALGTNDAHLTPDGSSWSTLLPKLTHQCVVWPSLHDADPEINAFDETIHNLVKHFPNVHVYDGWHTSSSLHPEWFGPDGVHLTDAGKHAYANALVDATKLCG